MSFGRNASVPRSSFWDPSGGEVAWARAAGGVVRRPAKRRADNSAGPAARDIRTLRRRASSSIMTEASHDRLMIPAGPRNVNSPPGDVLRDSLGWDIKERMKKIIVLGSGMVGRIMAVDLARDFDVTAADLRPANLERLKGTPVKPLAADLSDAGAVGRAVEGFDLVVGAVPGSLGFSTLRAVLEAGKDTVDISFFPEDAFLLDGLAAKNGRTAVVDCGVAPGMSNMILGHHASRMNVTHFACYVGGLPFKRDFPFEYKAPFSPADVIEEYTRPARYVENGHLVVKPALSDAELMDFPEVGTLEAFNSDGLRSLIATMSIPT
jgi:hypothetical protein